MASDYFFRRVVFIMVGLCICRVAGHGRLLDPPGRSTMWRFEEFRGAPINYNDHGLNCGGFAVQWQDNGGQCGICGDNWANEEPRAHETGGTYGNKVIVKTYKEGAVIDITVELTVSHLGWFRFKICPLTGDMIEATHECLDQYILELDDSETGETKTMITGYAAMTLEMKYKLPPGVTCSRCVFQWKYHAGNSWGRVSPGSDQGCLGCGAQEEFYACADIEITADGNTGTQSPTETVPTVPTEPVTAPPTEPVTAPPTEPVTAPPTEPITASPTDPITVPPTGPVATAPTEPITAPPTEPIITAATEPVTTASTVPVTTPPYTQKPTKKPKHDNYHPGKPGMQIFLCRGAGNLDSIEEIASRCRASCSSGCCPASLCNHYCRSVFPPVIFSTPAAVTEPTKKPRRWRYRPNRVKRQAGKAGMQILRCRGAGDLDPIQEVARKCRASCFSGCCPPALCNEQCLRVFPPELLL